MEAKKILTRDNKSAEELCETVVKNYKGIALSFIEAYYLDYEVDEDSGMINREKQVKHYTKDQMERNLKALKSAYLVAKGAASPDEIISFRKKYRIPASTLSLVLGFSKNTISNIENEGVTSLATGRLIKMCLNNPAIISYYVKICDAIDHQKRAEISQRLMDHEGRMENGELRMGMGLR